MNRFTALIQPRTDDKKAALVEELKEAISYRTLKDMTLNDIAGLFGALVKDKEVADFADRITFGDLVEFSIHAVPQEEPKRTRLTMAGKEALGVAVRSFFRDLNGKVPMSAVHDAVIPQHPEFTKQNVSIAVKELVDAKLVGKEGQLRSTVYFKRVKK